MKGGDLEGSDVLERVFEAIDVDSDQRVTFGEFHEFLSQNTGAKKLIFRPGEKMKLKEGHSVIL
jgi:Ca2+-binding EF-hand superfamily protein